jgi:hypothetical protein
MRTRIDREYHLIHKVFAHELNSCNARLVDLGVRVIEDWKASRDRVKAWSRTSRKELYR